MIDVHDIEAIKIIIKNEILENLTIDTKMKNYGFNGACIDIELKYEDEIISETSISACDIQQCARDEG